MTAGAAVNGLAPAQARSRPNRHVFGLLPEPGPIAESDPWVRSRQPQPNASRSVTRTADGRGRGNMTMLAGADGPRGFWGARGMALDSSALRRRPAPSGGMGGARQTSALGGPRRGCVPRSTLQWCRSSRDRPVAVQDPRHSAFDMGARPCRDRCTARRTRSPVQRCLLLRRDRKKRIAIR